MASHLQAIGLLGSASDETADRERAVEYYWQGIQFHRNDRAILLLDRRGSVIRLNEAAELILTASDGLLLQAERLHCALSVETERLKLLVEQAAVRSDPVGGSMRITRPSGKSPYGLSAYPLARPCSIRMEPAPSALVIIVDDIKRTHPNRERWRSLFGLTHAESRIADHLKAGEPDGEIAAALGIRISTVAAMPELFLPRQVRGVKRLWRIFLLRLIGHNM